MASDKTNRLLYVIQIKGFFIKCFNFLALLLITVVEIMTSSMLIHITIGYSRVLYHMINWPCSANILILNGNRSDSVSEMVSLHPALFDFKQPDEWPHWWQFGTVQTSLRSLDAICSNLMTF